jgi:hypothetical protein
VVAPQRAAPSARAKADWPEMIASRFRAVRRSLTYEQPASPGEPRRVNRQRKTSLTSLRGFAAAKSSHFCYLFVL